MRWGVDNHSERACRVFLAGAVTDFRLCSIRLDLSTYLHFYGGRLDRANDPAAHRDPIACAQVKVPPL